jgi:hypothetical protein
MGTIRVQFPDGRVLDVNVETVSEIFGRGIWGMEYLASLARIGELFATTGERDARGGLILASYCGREVGY